MWTQVASFDHKVNSQVRRKALTRRIQSDCERKMIHVGSRELSKWFICPRAWLVDIPARVVQAPCLKDTRIKHRCSLGSCSQGGKYPYSPAFSTSVASSALRACWGWELSAPTLRACVCCLHRVPVSKLILPPTRRMKQPLRTQGPVPRLTSTGVTFGCSVSCFYDRRSWRSLIELCDMAVAAVEESERVSGLSMHR